MDDEVINDEEVRKHQERVYNFTHVPMHLERFLFLGYVICLHAYLSTFTIVPMRMIFGREKRRNFLKMSMILTGVMSLHFFFDTAKLYHSIRGQSTLKLYVIYNVLEIADKLCSSFGLDILVFPSCPSFAQIFLSHAYVVVHSTILFIQLISLTVAINSYSNALLTLLVSNQFVELKSGVFKKFDKDTLFQLSCGDGIERFQLSIYLAIIVGLGSRWWLAPGAVLCSELIVDWLKHAFIAKFNHIHPEAYDNFCLSLRQQQGSLPRRIGFSVLPLVCVTMRIFLERVPFYCMACWLLMFPLQYIVSRLIKKIKIESRSERIKDGKYE